MHVPAWGQAAGAGLLADLVAKGLRALVVFAEPQASQACFRRLPAFSRKAVTWLHSLHRYSKIGMGVSFSVYSLL